MKICMFSNTVYNKFVKRKINFNILGLNTGNLLFWHALKKILKAESVPIHDCIAQRVDLSAYDAFVTTDLIWIQENVSHAFVGKLLEMAGDKPFVPISVGLQAPVMKKDFNIHPDTLKLLTQIAERSILGVRGNYTAEILNKHGITNLQVIGCPSLYYNLNEDFEVKKDTQPIMRVSCNFRSFHSNLSMQELEFLKYCANNDYVFCEQTQQPFSLDICKSVKDFEIIYKWLNLSKFIFFDMEDWIKFAAASQFSIGSRFHGNVVSIWNKKPALFIVIDSRTREMTEFFSLPSITMDEFDASKDISHYYNMADYSAFNKQFPVHKENFIKFLQANSLF